MSFIAVGAGAGYLIGGAGLATAAGAVVGGLYGASQSGGNASAPQANPQQIGQDTLQTQLNLAPQVLAANQLYGPQYAALNVANTNSALFGQTPTFDAAKFYAANPGAQADFQSSPEGRTAEQHARDWLFNTSQNPATLQSFYHNTGGLLDTYGNAQPALSGLTSAANTAQRTADINDVANLGPAAQAAYLAANPNLARANSQLDATIGAARNVTPTQLTNTYNPPAGGLTASAAAAPGTLAAAYAQNPGSLTAAHAAAPGALGVTYATAPGDYQASTAGPTSLTPTLLRDAAGYAAKSPIQQALEQQALAGLSRGGELSAEDLRDAQQTARGAAAARGIYDSNTALSAEVLNTAAMKRQRLQEAQSLASGVDASGQAALNAGRSFATGVEGQQQNVNMFNAGQQNSAASQIYGTNANLNLANAGAANNAAAATYAATNAANQFNAGQTNSLASQAYGTQANTALANAGAANNAAAATYGATNATNQFNVGQANSLASQAYGQANQNAQFGAGLSAQQQLNQSQINTAAQQQQINNQFQLANTYQSQATDPFAVVLGRSGVPGQVAGTVAQGGAVGSAGPTLFDPFNPAITSIYAGNQANQTAANIAAGNNRSAMTGSLLQLGGQLGAAYLCWVARAAFGPRNPRWKAVQRWMIHKAPIELWNLYMGRGPVLAEQLVADGRREEFRGIFRRLIRGDTTAAAELTAELNAVEVTV